MDYSPSFSSLKKYSVAVLLLFLSSMFPTESHAVSQFGTGMREKKIPAALNLDDIWFYERDMAKIIPEIDFTWVTVVLRSSERADSSSILEKAQAIKIKHNEIIDIFYDSNLAEDACFFKLREGIKRDVLQYLLRDLNNDKVVDYTHPVIKIRDKSYAFFNVFAMKWKTGADRGQRENLLKQVHASFDEKGNIYRVNIFEMPFFKALNLLAEDVTIFEITPYLVELKPSIRTSLNLALHGCNIGDKVPFSFTVEFSDRISIDPSSLANINLKPDGIQKELFEVQFDPYDYVKAASKSPVHITGWMKFYTPGEFTIPAIKVKYACPSCSGGEVRLIETDPVHFKVSSIVPSLQTENKLIIPMDNINPDYHIEAFHREATKRLVTSLVSFFIALMCLGWFIATVYAIKRQRERLGEKKREDILKEKLKLFLGTEPSGPHWIYIGEGGTMLREYLTARYQVSQDPLGGSGEVFFEAIRLKIPEPYAQRIHAVLKEIDNCVALELDRYPDLERLKTDMIEIIGTQ